MNDTSCTKQAVTGRSVWWVLAGLLTTLSLVWLMASDVNLILIVVALCVFIAAVGAMLKWPDLTTLIGLGVIYSNVSVVLVRFHGLPSVLPAATLGMLAWPFLYRVFVRKENVLLPPAAPFLLAYIFVQFISAGLSKDPRHSFAGVLSFLLEGVVVYVLVSNIIRTRRLVVACFWALALCAVVMGGVPLLKQVSGSYTSDFGGFAQTGADVGAAEASLLGEVPQQRATGTIGEQNRYGQLMIILVPISLALLPLSSGGKYKLAAVTATFFGLVGFALAFSRGAAVGFVLGVVIAVLLNILPRKQIKWLAYGGLIALMLLPQYLNRLASLAELTTLAGPMGASGQTDGAIRGRLTEMTGALLAFRDHPLFGVGPEMFSEYSQQYSQVIGLRPLSSGREAHSLPLDILAETGIAGFLVFFGLVIAVLSSLLRSRKRAIKNQDKEGAVLVEGIAFAIILYLTTGLFLHMSYIRYFWLLIGLADAISMLAGRKDLGGDYLPDFRKTSQQTN